MLLSLLTGEKKVKTIYCESARDIARDMLVAEQIYKIAKDNGIDIICAAGLGIPNKLCKLAKVCKV